MRSTSVSLPTKCLTVTATSCDCTPRTIADASRADNSGSSLRHSKVRPPIGVRCRLTVGASTMCTALRRASRPRITPRRCAMSTSHDAPITIETGMTTPGVRVAPSDSPRTPLGPSDILSAGMPTRVIAWVRHVDAPPSRRHFSSRVRRARRSAMREVADSCVAPESRAASVTGETIDDHASVGFWYVGADDVAARSSPPRPEGSAARPS